jgi:hypothetical protein
MYPALDTYHFSVSVTETVDRVIAHRHKHALAPRLITNYCYNVQSRTNVDRVRDLAIASTCSPSSRRSCLSRKAQPLENSFFLVESRSWAVLV